MFGFTVESLKEVLSKPRAQLIGSFTHKLTEDGPVYRIWKGSAAAVLPLAPGVPTIPRRMKVWYYWFLAGDRRCNARLTGQVLACMGYQNYEPSLDHQHDTSCASVTKKVLFYSLSKKTVSCRISALHRRILVTDAS